MNWFKPCSLEVAKALAILGYTEKTNVFWDRHNPRSRQGGKPTDPELVWKLSPTNFNRLDNTCCLAAPNKLQAAWFIFKKALK